ncbi:uncharacterized protein EAE97_009888 [Botrytis byssoidea]|uniref:Uncharacterized protein n=1 Tax=Botrytis byssoidea TaxID=139641 RepID=A0A9P5I354_9HELO|nr:uncharacterized protein EAE97_009888 [Botrytis byssoidea]KAF7928090.1 hypothetical protein EAE97_009888 [Botrytis byssoidea]
MARDVADGNRGTPWWFEINASEDLIQNWMVAERKDEEPRNADKWNKAQELNKITQSVSDRKRKSFAVAEVERKFNTAKAARAVKKTERDQALQNSWDSEFERWMEELKIADSHDGRYTGPDEDGVYWPSQSLININKDISMRHLAKCMPSFQEPGSRGVHCKDCEDENEVGRFWDEVHRLRLQGHGILYY